MRATERRLEISGELLDVDVVDEGTWVALIDGGAGGQQLLFGEDAAITLPRSFRFPLVRAAGRGHALVADSRVEDEKEPNAYLFDQSGNVEGVFAFGDGIQDVLISTDDIVVSYFDEGVFGAGGGGSPAAEGLAVFSFDGRLRLGYNTSRFSGDVFIADCYCATWADRRRLFFCPYTAGEPDFPLVTLDLETTAHELWPTPELLHGSAALTVGRSDEGREVVFFHGPYDDRTGIYRWLFGDDRHDWVAQHPGPLRGLRGGRFLASGTAGYTILDPTALN
jgi:hypothetical protein